MLLMNYAQVTAMAQNLYWSIQGPGNSTALNPELKILTIYSGTIPTVNKAFQWNPANYDSQVLFNYTTLSIAAITGGTGQSTVGFRLNAAMSNRVATGTGTATWYAIHNGTAHSSGNGGPAILGSVTANPAAADTLLLNTTNLVSGGNFNIMDLTIRFLG